MLKHTVSLMVKDRLSPSGVSSPNGFQGSFHPSMSWCLKFSKLVQGNPQPKPSGKWLRTNIFDKSLGPNVYGGSPVDV